MGRRVTDASRNFRIVAAIAVPLVRCIARFRIRGLEHLPTTGPFVLAPNHFTNVDPATVGAAVWMSGRAPRYLAKASLWRIPVLRTAMQMMEQVPVERSGRTHGSDPLAAAAAFLQAGSGIIVYPEGTLTRDPDLWPMRGKTGAVRLALEHGVPLVPMAHWGDQRILPRYSKKVHLFPRTPVDVLYGPPVDLSRFDGRPLDQKVLLEATEVLMDALTVLVEELRGETAPAIRWDPAANNQKETGRFE